MKERKSIIEYNPTIWIDANSQDAVFRQSRDLPRRNNIDSFLEPARFNQDIGFYSYTYEYGYLKNKNREKYIKQYVQRLENPYLVAEQLIYRHSQLTPNNFMISTRIVEGKKTKNFISFEYNMTNYLSRNIFLYPYKVENSDGDSIANIGNQEQEDQQFSFIQDAIDSGGSLLKFIHTGKLGTYSVYTPLELNSIVTRDLFTYFNNPSLPSLDEYVVQPDELDFYIEMDSNK